METEKRRIKRGAKPNARRQRGLGIVYVRVECPEVLDVVMAQYRRRTCMFLHRIREQRNRLGVGIHIDFSPLKKAYPSGVLMLIAELHRFTEKALHERPVVCSRASSSLMEEVLTQVGIYDRIGVQCDITPSSDSVVHWRIATGALADGSEGYTVLQDYEGRLADGLQRGLYDGMVEAMTNTVQHAYIGAKGDVLKRNIGRRWWMLSQEKDDELIVVFCDLGIGIPESLPKSKTFAPGAVVKMMEKMGLDRSDASAIEVAVKLGETRTGAAGRGKGLSEIVGAVDLSSDAGVIISSNKGTFRRYNGKTESYNDARSIFGTMIHWKVPIASETRNVGDKGD